MTRIMLGLVLIAAVGCTERGQNGRATPQGSPGEFDPSGAYETALAEERAPVEQAIRSQHGGGFTIIRWHAAEPYYAALIGQVGRPGYQGISQVFSREEALESLRRTEEAIKDVLAPGDPPPPPSEIKELRRIGSRLVVEYTTGSGANKSLHKDTYLVAHDASILNGELELGTKEATLQGSSVQGP